VTGKDTGKDVGKATLINALGSDEAQRRLAQYLRDAERHLADALGAQQGTRQGTQRFVASLFQQGRGAIRLAPDPVVARAGADNVAACLDARG
jgi:geranylgeranyl diphosphate synthase type II